MVRLQPDDLAALDDWIRAQPEIVTRPEAIRALMAQGLGRATSVDDESLADLLSQIYRDLGPEEFEALGFPPGTERDVAAAQDIFEVRKKGPGHLVEMLLDVQHPAAAEIRRRLRLVSV